MTFLYEDDGTLSVYFIGTYNDGNVDLLRAAYNESYIEVAADTQFADNLSDSFDSFEGIAALDDDSMLVVSRGYAFYTRCIHRTH